MYADDYVHTKKQEKQYDCLPRFRTQISPPLCEPYTEKKNQRQSEEKYTIENDIMKRIHYAGDGKIAGIEHDCVSRDILDNSIRPIPE